MPRFQVYAVVVTAIMVGWAALVAAVPPIAAGMRVSEDFKGIPMRVGAWEGQDQPFDPKTYEALPTCSILARDYTDSSGNPVNLSIVYGRDLGDFHQPELCMEGTGWRRTSTEQIWLHPKAASRHKATVTTLTKGYEDIVMVYWFYMGGEVAPGMGKQKFWALFDAMIRGGLAPSAMVKFTATVTTDDETARQSAIELSELLGKSILDTARKPPKYRPSSEY